MLVSDSSQEVKEMNEVQVYCKPGCVQCEYTKKKLDEFQIPHVDLDIVEHPIFAEQLAERGVQRLPYVVAGDQTWTGFQYDKLKGLRAIADPSYGL
jgi:glutaredoxin-like protein NrdH